MAKRIFSFNKLVRNNIPQIMHDKNCVIHHKKLEKLELIAALKDKLIEEANEVVQSKSMAELVEELADLTEVIHALSLVSSLNLEDIEQARVAKNEVRGSFSEGIFISKIETEDENPATKYFADQPDRYPDIGYWVQLQQLVTESEIVIDRPKNSAHPRYPSFIYPVDYGYLKDTKASDGNEVDIWVGSAEDKIINGVLCTVDPTKKDVETKVIYACTVQEIDLICRTMNVVLKAVYVSNPIR